MKVCGVFDWPQTRRNVTEKLIYLACDAKSSERKAKARKKDQCLENEIDQSALRTATKFTVAAQ